MGGDVDGRVIKQTFDFGSCRKPRVFGEMINDPAFVANFSGC